MEEDREESGAEAMLALALEPTIVLLSALSSRWWSAAAFVARAAVRGTSGDKGDSGSLVAGGRGTSGDDGEFGSLNTSGDTGELLKRFRPDEYRSSSRDPFRNRALTPLSTA